MRPILWLAVGLLFGLSDFLHPGLAGAIYGLVSDSVTRAPIGDAPVEVDFGYATSKIKTLPNGYYSCWLPEGRNYIVTIKKSGFETAVRKGVRVRPNDYTEVNIDLKCKTHKISKAAFLAANGKYVRADEARQGRVVADSASLGPPETFTVIHLNGSKDQVALRAPSGKFVCADLSAGAYLVADRKAVGDWETFQMVHFDGAKTYLKSKKGYFVSADLDQGGRLIANRSAVKEWEIFSFIKK